MKIKIDIKNLTIVKSERNKNFNYLEKFDVF